MALGAYVTQPPAPPLLALLPLIGTRLQLQRLGTTGRGSLGFVLISFPVAGMGRPHYSMLRRRRQLQPRGLLDEGRRQLRRKRPCGNVARRAPAST